MATAVHAPIAPYPPARSSKRPRANPARPTQVRRPLHERSSSQTNSIVSPPICLVVENPWGPDNVFAKTIAAKRGSRLPPPIIIPPSPSPPPREPETETKTDSGKQETGSENVVVVVVAEDQEEQRQQQWRPVREQEQEQEQEKEQEQEVERRMSDGYQSESWPLPPTPSPALQPTAQQHSKEVRGSNSTASTAYNDTAAGSSPPTPLANWLSPGTTPPSSPPTAVAPDGLATIKGYRRSQPPRPALPPILSYNEEEEEENFATPMASAQPTQTARPHHSFSDYDYIAPQATRVDRPLSAASSDVLPPSNRSSRVLSPDRRVVHLPRDSDSNRDSTPSVMSTRQHSETLAVSREHLTERFETPNEYYTANPLSPTTSDPNADRPSPFSSIATPQPGYMHGALRNISDNNNNSSSSSAASINNHPYPANFRYSPFSGAWVELPTTPTKEPKKSTDDRPARAPWGSFLSTIASESESTSPRAFDHSPRENRSRPLTIASPISPRLPYERAFPPHPILSPPLRRPDRDSGEQYDTVGDLPAPASRAARNPFHRRWSAESGMSSTSDISSTLPSWVRLYYSRGEPAHMLGGGPSFPDFGARRASDSTSISPGSDIFLNGSSRAHAAPPPIDPTTYTSHFDEHMSPESSIRSANLAQQGITVGRDQLSPHLQLSRNAQARLSAWNPPSLEEPVRDRLLGRCNRQVVLFCLGFVLPPAWFLAAVLPLPIRPDPAFGKDENEMKTEIENVVERTLSPIDERRFLKAQWWRNLNRLMSMIGVAVLSIILALVIMALTTK